MKTIPFIIGLVFYSLSSFSFAADGKMPGDNLDLNAVLELFRRRMNIENFNKKALYIMIREMTGSNTQHITRVVNQMKRYYVNMMEEFSNDGSIDTSNTGSIF